MIHIPIILKAADSILGWFGLLRKEQTERNEQEQGALKALYIAVLETSMYFRRLERPSFARTKRETREFERDIQKEEGLARLWTEASLELRPVNPELAERCFLKGQYWADRDAWTPEDVHHAGIVLERLRKDSQALLYE